MGYVEHDGEDVIVFSIADGYYLDELRDEDRLITTQSPLKLQRRPRRERMPIMAKMRRADKMGKMMPTGYRDFAGPEALEWQSELAVKVDSS